MTLKRSDWQYLIIILLLATLWRAWHWRVAAPYPHSGDEKTKMKIAMQIICLRDPNPHYFDQPSFVIYSLTGLYRVYFAARGIEPVLDQCAAIMDEEFATLLFIGRGLMIALGLLNIGAVYLLGRELFNRRVGLLAALFLAIVPLHAIYSYYTKEDIPLTFWMTVALVFIARLWRYGRTRDYLLAGLFSGVAMSAKYPGIVLLVPLLGAHLLRGWKVQSTQSDKTTETQRTRSFSVFSWSNAVFSLMAMGAGFLLITPFALLDFVEFWRGWSGQMEYIQTGHHDYISISAWDYWWTFHLRQSIVPGIGWVLVLLAGGAVVYGLVRRNRAVWLLLMIIAPFYMLIEGSRAKPYPFFERYALPLIPPLLVCAAWGIWRIRRRWGQFAAGIVLLGAVAYPWTTTTLSVLTIAPDTRILALEWIRDNVAVGDKLALSNNLEYAQRTIDADWLSRYRVEELEYELPNALAARGVDYVAVTEFEYRRYLIHEEVETERSKFYDELFTQTNLVQEIRPRYPPCGKHNPVVRIYGLRKSAEIEIE